MGEMKATPARNTIIRVETRVDYLPGREFIVTQPGDYDPKRPTMDFLLPVGWTPEQVDKEIQKRVASDAEAAKRSVVDAALNAEFEKRRAAVDYAKTGADAVATVFPVAVKP